MSVIHILSNGPDSRGDDAPGTHLVGRSASFQHQGLRGPGRRNECRRSGSERPRRFGPPFPGINLGCGNPSKLSCWLKRYGAGRTDPLARRGRANHFLRCQIGPFGFANLSGRRQHPQCVTPAKAGGPAHAQFRPLVGLHVFCTKSATAKYRCTSILPPSAAPSASRPFIRLGQQRFHVDVTGQAGHFHWDLCPD